MVGVMEAAARPTPQQLLDAALEYARAGFGVFPCHTPINGVCDCQEGPRCDSPGKHPWTRNGLTDATTDELQIRRWWKVRPIANVAISMPEGYVAVDVDGEHGQHQLAEEQKHLTATAIQTSGRGAHYVYRTRNRIPPRSKLIPDSVKGAHDGVDLRGPGSYIMAAPSVHASGRIYEWSIPLSQIEIAPPWLEAISMQSGGTTIGDRAPVDFTLVMAGLSEGQRKWELYRAASKLRAADVPVELAIMLAQQAASNCRPPLAAAEAERKVREAYAKFPPNAVAADLPAGVTLLSHDSVMVEFETCRFVFSDLEKSGRELHAEMEVRNLLPGTPQEPYTLRLNLLSMSAREAARREIEHVLGNPSKGHWTLLFSRAITKAQDAYLSVDRSVRASDIEAPDDLQFVIPDFCVDEGLSIIFGAGASLKTFFLMRAALDVSRGMPFLGRPTLQRKVLYIDCETGRKTFAYRLRRLCAGEGLGPEAAADIRYWWADGIPIEDQVEAIRRCCDENEIGFICLDHLAAACSGDANEQSVASRLLRALNKIGRPVLALAHITGNDTRNPEAVSKPFGSIFWENLSRRTIYILRQQEDESAIADIGFYPKKINDGGRTAPFGARVVFDDPSGPITIDGDDLANKGVLSTVRGLQHVIWDMLAAPMLAEEIADATGKSERHCKDVMKAHPRLFVEVVGGGGRGLKARWARIEVRSPYPEDDYSFEEEAPF